MNELGARLSDARKSAPATMPAQIEMYKSMEADLRKYVSVLQCLQKEVDARVKMFPLEREDAPEAIQVLGIHLKGADLLRRQIALAKEIEPLDPDAQLSVWQTLMEPLLVQHELTVVELDTAREETE